MSIERSSKSIRNDFLRFFEERGHTIVKSASLVPQNDPTLLFTNAGMNQFKDVFLGTGERRYQRATNTQKCLRVSGKHNDLEEVGHDTYHHTFFEMLGNWSFGDYFKREAIGWAWELLVSRWQLDPSRLYATVHEGDAALGLAADEEAAELWRSETSIDPSNIKYCGTKDNFWMMGEVGPCGPCSEIHIDLRPDDERASVPGLTLVNADDPRVMEIWNLVFIQYNATGDGTLAPLKAKHIDTGMGFERVVAVLQGKTSNYDTDLFEPLLSAIAGLSPRDEVAGYDQVMLEDPVERERVRVAMRVVADHARTCALAVADGVLPGNVGRGYVVRRILRRAVRYGYQALDLREPFLYRLIDPLAVIMGATFDELNANRSYLERVIRSEEENFLETLGTGISFFDRLVPYVHRIAGAEETSEEEGELEEVLGEVKQDRVALDLLEKAYPGLDRAAIFDSFTSAAARRELPGDVAFLLHDTYGFPVDLTQLMAREQALGVGMERYAVLMTGQRDRARSAAAFRIGDAGSDEWVEVSTGTDSNFLGYERTEAGDLRIRKLRTAGGTGQEARFEVLLDQTPFYAESGGQVGDVGTLDVGGEIVQVVDTQKQQGSILHVVDSLPEDPDAPVVARVDGGRRRRTERHHTATHLVHAALREILGKHVAQRGSLVAPDRLRFDFSHFERVGPEQLRQVELRVNEAIRENIPKQEERDVPVQEALSRGAMALFGEKYGAHVRVITFDPGWSVELCGGTHVEATGAIGVFRFVSEGSVAAGVRRVEAVVGEDAIALIHREIDQLESVRGHFRGLQRPLHEEIAEVIAQNRQLQSELEQLRAVRLERELDSFIEQSVQLGDVRLVTGRVASGDMEALRNLGQAFRDRLKESAVGVLGAVDPDGGKVYLVVTVSDDLLTHTKLEAGKLVGMLARIVGGGGGGRPALATAGGRSPEKLDEALARAPTVVEEMLGSRD